MDFKFDQLFDKIVTQSKVIKENEDMAVETEARKKPQFTEEQAKANFEAIVEKVKEAFDEYGVDCDEYEDQDEDGITLTAEWRWETKDGGDDYLGLSYCNGKAEYEDNGGIGDLDLTDVEGTAKYLIDEFIFNPEYGGIGCEDRTLDEVVPELIEKWKNDGEHDDIDWESVDEEEFIDENIDTPFETEDDIADELEDWLYTNYSEE